MHRDAAGIIIEHRYELEVRTERLQILAQRRDPHILGMLQLGDRSLSDIETASQLDLADCFAMSKFVETDHFESLNT